MPTPTPSPSPTPTPNPDKTVKPTKVKDGVVEPKDKPKKK